MVAVLVLSSCSKNEPLYKVYEEQDFYEVVPEEFTHEDADSCDKIGTQKTISFMGKEYTGVCYAHKGIGYSIGTEECYYETEDGIKFTVDCEYGTLLDLSLSDNEVDTDSLKLSEDEYLDKAKEILSHISSAPNVYEVYTNSSNEVTFERFICKTVNEETGEQQRYYTTDGCTITMDSEGNLVSFSSGTIDRFIDFDFDSNILGKSVKATINKLFKEYTENDGFYADFTDFTIREYNGVAYAVGRAYVVIRVEDATGVDKKETHRPLLFVEIG
jgi:hypothetical protein